MPVLLQSLYSLSLAFQMLPAPLARPFGVGAHVLRDQPETTNHNVSLCSRDIVELERLLLTIGPDVPVRTTAAVHHVSDVHIGPFGVVQMAGNTWVMTCTNFFAERDMCPLLGRYSPKEFMNHESAFYILKGGIWTSPSVCLRSDIQR